MRRINVPVSNREGADDSSGSELSAGRPPVEVDVLHNASDISSLSGPPIRLANVAGSDISSMPADSMVDGPSHFMSPKKRGSHSVSKDEFIQEDRLKAPRTRSRSISKESKERLVVQRAVEKVKREHGIRTRESTKRRTSDGSDRRTRSRSVSKEEIIEDVRTGKSRSSKRRDDSLDRNLHPSEISVISSRSNTSNSSINNPKLLTAVEDAIKNLILPELTALREENQSLRNRSKYDESVRESRTSMKSRSRDDIRSVSKSSSLPHISKKSESISERGDIIDESGTHRRTRRSSKGSDRSDSTMREESSRRRSSREKEKKSHVKESLAAGLAGVALGALGVKALKHHASSSSVERESPSRRRSSKGHSRSRTPSLTESRLREATREEDVAENQHSIPPLPMQSMLDSDLTRDSILSAETERPHSRSSVHMTTPTKEIREVSRGSPVHIHSPGPTVAMGSPQSYEYRPEHDAISRALDEHDSPRSNHGGHLGYTAAALGAAAGAAAVATAAHHHADKQHYTPNRALSPIQSENSYLHEEIAEHPRVKSIRSNNSMSSERRRKKSVSPISADSSPSGAIRSKKRPEGISFESPYEVLPEDEYNAETPRADDLDQWLEREHAQNEYYRNENDRHSLVSDLEEERDYVYEDESFTEPLVINTNQGYKTVGANPEYVRTPDAAASAVASLHNGSLQDPSTVSFHTPPYVDERPISQADSYAQEQDEYSAPLTTMGRLPGSTSKLYWEAVRDQAMAETGHADRGLSPAQSEARTIDEKPVMHSTYVPGSEDMPDFNYNGHDDDDLLTNPSMIEGKLGEGIEMSPFPGRQGSAYNLRDAGLLGLAAAGVGLGLAHGAKQNHDNTQHFQDTSENTNHDLGIPTRDLNAPGYNSSPAQLKDEGYISANPGAGSPVPHPLGIGNPDSPGLGYEEEFVMDDPFMTQKHLRHESGLSQGMASPLYDASTGKGIDRIQSKDVVALMDHLTVRDAQRNARDTEIMVTLVRSAAEMRNNFEHIKRFIAEQDQVIMNNMERHQDVTVQRVLNGPRAMPSSSPRTRKSSEDDEDLPTKRKNIVKRALKGLSMRSTNDLTKIEGMLMHLLDEVEGLKTTQALQRSSQPVTQATSLNSYEHLRAAPDSGYEPEGRDGTNSSPAQSGYLSNSSSRQANGRHSGYDGLRSSEGHRISTVLEGDEEGDDHLHTPTSKRQYVDSLTPPTKEKARNVSVETPPEQTAQFSAEPTPKTDKSKGRHKSTTSSLFSGFPKISRWSKTTTSTIPDTAKKARPYSGDSQSGSNLHVDENEYEIDPSYRDTPESYTKQGAQKSRRSVSPLIPDDYSYEEYDQYDLDPKYQAHRNSLNLQHPQPRPGPTHRHQNHLETQAMVYENPPTPDAHADQWGTTPALALNRSRFSGASTAPRHSPIQSEDGLEDEEDQHPPARPPKVLDDGPLVPPKIPLNGEPAYGMYGVPLMNSGMHIASPLEPIEEVRNSLETDRSSVRYVSSPPIPVPAAILTTLSTLPLHQDLLLCSPFSEKSPDHEKCLGTEVQEV